MRISSNYFNQYASQVNLGNNSNGMFSQTNLSTSTTSGNDEVQISKKGQMMSRVINRMQQMDTSQMKANMQSFEQKMNELDINKIDPKTMTEEELNDTLTKIQEGVGESAVNGLKSVQTLDVESLTEDEKREMVSTFKEQATQMQSRVAHMKSMMRSMGMSGMRGMGMPGMGDKGGLESVYKTKESTDEDMYQMLLDTLDNIQDSELKSSDFYNTLLNDVYGSNKN